uniref:RPGRIP1 C-terminal domain-containing protein n=1 Tax=Graphocephala atropunctata TaxID=36148 RepID=A0A1B6LTK7_9HEMI
MSKQQEEEFVSRNGQQKYNCHFEISICEVELDNKMLNYLKNIEESPKVFVEWSFLGMEQRTPPMPADKAFFQTRVAFFGPFSEKMANHVQQSTMPIYLMLEKSNGKVVKLGEGSLNLTSAIQQPNTGFVRCVDLPVNQGLAIVYCSFKLYNCNQGEILLPQKTLVEDTLEVRVGHVRFTNSDVQSDVEGSHLYIEYSLLGHCGPELETDSVPKAEVMRFNHTRRLKVDQQNFKHLEPMLKPKYPQNLRFFLLSEPCSLIKDTDVKMVGFADLNLVEDLMKKNKDVISEALPLYSEEGKVLGRLSVTVIGKATLQNYINKQYQSLDS